MKLRRVAAQNVRSFLDRQELGLPGDISILIGPNGGGKTNLLDIVVLALRLFLLKSWVPKHNPAPDSPDRYDWVSNDTINVALLDKHSSGADQEQRIEIDIEVTQRDIENIARAKEEAPLLKKNASSRYTSLPSAIAESWDTATLAPGTICSYTITSGRLAPARTPTERTFQQYLETFEVDSWLRAETQRESLSTPMISLPVNRSTAGINTSVALAGFNEYDYKRSVDAASSRSAASIVPLALGRLAARFRNLLELDTGGAKRIFYEDPTIASFTRILRSLGYGWTLECTSPLRNQYDIRLTKQGASFRLGAASSGEKELLTYLFAIYALNVRDALIVIDEPELHLHPRWQRTLLTLFEQLAGETGNQFIMATHSPVFVSPSSIQYVSRVYSEQQQSRIVRLGDSELPDRRHLFTIVNTQNNERVFFADRVVLVEGPSDRIFFEALLRCSKIDEGTGAVYEVVSVGGKLLFGQYQKLLAACHVSHVIIADLDYINQVGTPEVKALLEVSTHDLKESMLDGDSTDTRTLVTRMDEALSSRNTENLQQLWQYMKSRHTRSRRDLSNSEQRLLDEFITEQRNHNIYILSGGALEQYLPAGYKNKNMDKLIRLVSSPDLWECLPAERKDELRTIVDGVRL